MTCADLLAEFICKHAILHGDFILSSGEKSAYYIDCRRVTMLSEGASLVGNMVFDLIATLRPDAIGGPASGAIPIVVATMLWAQQNGQALKGFYVRSEVKVHGTGQEIEGNLPLSGGSVVIVDDVITTGDSLLRTIKSVEARGCKVRKVVVLLDRLQGGSDLLKAKGYDFTAFVNIGPHGEVEVA